ncbi:LOW QUALITY PROTEIN: uncharacterized protein LOC129224309 [Uloborus diversus]|uniref:LOW QUALITY PROTEIN: uncharacterized protein LOC129224309 n=1 Tax=Uloborus diversus TaxID=327109 RepID=UPI00240A4F33|nr:LOW QUALITY PROTEIN: uncharacterized protein LOC129224309 [Uloborus diversus]
MSSKGNSRSSSSKKDGSSRYATRLLALEKSKRASSAKESNAMKACECLLKSEGWKGSKHSQNAKFPVKKGTGNKCFVKDSKNKFAASNREKVVIVSKRSSSVSVVKSCNLRKSVSVRKVSYSTSVVLSSDEDSDSEEESDDEEKLEYLKKKKTILKHTTSKVKSRYSRPKKKSDVRAAQKAKAIKLLCEKLSTTNKQKSLSPTRELRPRFPYAVMQEWPTARAARMASLNALAKVHVLYENEGKTIGDNFKDADENSLIDFLNEENTDDEMDIKNETKPIVKKNENQNSTRKSETQCSSVKRNENHTKSFKKNESAATKKSEKNKNSEPVKVKKEQKNKTEFKMAKKTKKRKFSDVEIIDTRVCKRMASLNAQAILAASYLQEPKEPKPKRIPKRVEEKSESSSDIDVKEIFLESKCDVQIIETEQKAKTSTVIDLIDIHDKNEEKSSSQSDLKEDPRAVSKSTSLPDSSYQKSWTVESDVSLAETRQHSINSQKDESNTVVSTTAATKVGLTQYTEVTKVHINARNDVEIKEESKSERKIERIIGNDDVAITQMYHYQSKNANESYCLQMQTTYKPASKNLTPSSLPLAPSSPMRSHLSEPLIPGRQNYYSHGPLLPAQPYHMNPVTGIPPVMGMDHHIPRQYGASAFTVPHYRHPHHMQYPQSDYGYYQPAGPLIQPQHEQYTIHKPVPYHPQPQPHLHQPPQRPQLPVSPRDRYHSSEGPRGQRNSSEITPHPSSVSHSQNSIPSNHIPAAKLVQPEPQSAVTYKHHPQRYKSPNWEMKQNHGIVTNTPYCYPSYQNEPSKELHTMNSPDSARYPLRPPSVIEITEDNSRDTKTYIQLEVPKNSHREKIVVVDVENDEIDKKCHIPAPCDPIIQNYSTSKEKMVTDKPEISVKSEMCKQDKILVKSEVEKPSTSEEILETNSNITETKMPDVMVIEIKKKKESAVIRRARLHGKQRTFRDCYNRPLAQLSKAKKSENTASGEHLTKHFQPLVSLPRLVLPKVSNKKPNHGWSWEGKCFEKQVYISNDELPCIRKCYSSIRHVEGDVICVKDCVFLRSGPRKTDLPFVAKITALWENPIDNEMTMSLLWFYRPEHTETGKKLHHMDDEVFASKHKDVNSVACIEDKCFVLTYLEYCRYRKKCKLAEDNIIPLPSVVPEVEDYPRKKSLPPVNISPDLVLFCRKVYDFRQKRLLKNPT